ncbi:hypothetical protein [Aquimarina megaterium]|uniref:hypothetical protein n=1 Tax=Aquimarina megaterium TaxID=1443666 RepID=UPI0009449B88|nr:hypothetical protein [Aquimarina megaterium]
MKKVVLTIVAVLLTTLWACEKENSIEEQITEDVKEIDSNISKKAGASQRALCIYSLTLDKQICDDRDMTCRCDPRGSVIGVCAQIQCLPNVFNPITPEPVYSNLCKIIRCDWVYNDPWRIYDKVDPRVFNSIKDVLKLTIKSDTKAIPFAMNKNILGLQFYKPNNMMYRDSKTLEAGPSMFHLKNTVILDKVYLKRLGLKGNVIKPGKYPVIFNKRNKTYNVILKVK